jgi:hypothetical protein
MKGNWRVLPFVPGSLIHSDTSLFIRSKPCATAENEEENYEENIT